MPEAATSVPAGRRGGRSARTVRRPGGSAPRDRTVKPASYDRRKDLPGLLALWPWEIEDTTCEGHRRLVALLRRALRLERQRGMSGHWTYDVARHARLLRAYKCEAESLRSRLRDNAKKNKNVVLPGEFLPIDGTWSGSRAAPAPVEEKPFEEKPSSLRPASCRGPSSWPGQNGRPRSSALPSGSRAAGPTSPGIPPGSDCSGCADGASAT